MTLDEAKAALTRGSRFGDVYPELVGRPDDHTELKRWFVFDHQPPNKGTTEPLPELLPRRPSPVQTGTFCKCGGLMVRTGTCETCSSCGTSSGGCG